MIGVVADDTTGANDIGIMFKRGGKTVKVLTYSEAMSDIGQTDSDVVIVDTDSRLDSPELGREKVMKATRFLKEIGSQTFYNKTCSVFRGNIGVEFDAMLDALENDVEAFCIIILAFPENQRQTLHGYHYVNHQLLEKTAFSQDPVHPMHQSNLSEILSAQTKRKVGNIYLETVRLGVSALREAIKEQKEVVNYVIIDAMNDNDLKLIAQAVSGYAVLAGSSAIARFIEPTNISDEPVAVLPEKNSKGILIISGSLTPQTKAQIAALKDSEIPKLVIDTTAIFEQNQREMIGQKLFEEGKQLLKKGQNILLMPSNETEVIDETKRRGLSLGYNEFEVSKHVSSFLAEISQQLITEVGITRFIVAGGDTSGTVTRELGIQGHYILEEIETGVPISLAIGDQPLMYVLKSGSFGGPNFLLKAIDKLQHY